MSAVDTDGEPEELFVKICGVTTEADALLAVGMGASAVGFVFAPSPRQMAPAAVADIVKRLPHETVTVGVFRDEAPQRVIEIANLIGLRAVQLHGVESITDTQWIAGRVGCGHACGLARGVGQFLLQGKRIAEVKNSDHKKNQ